MSSDENDYESEEVTEEEEEQSEEEEEEEPVKKRRQKKWKDPNKPKRNMSAFFLYSQAYRSQVKEDNPEAKFGDIVSSSLKYNAGPGCLSCACERSYLCSLLVELFVIDAEKLAGWRCGTISILWLWLLHDVYVSF